MKQLDIKRALAEHNMTQAQLCRILDIASPSLTSIIKGNPTVSKLSQIAEGIGCDITDLFFAPEPENGAIPSPSSSSLSPLSSPSENPPSEYPSSKSSSDLPSLFGDAVSENQQQGGNGEDHSIAGKEDAQRNEPMQAVTFCPHCGKKVMVGVVLI